MEDKKTKPLENEPVKQGPQSEDWATEALEEMEDFIESQGIYIRQ